MDDRLDERPREDDDDNEDDGVGREGEVVRAAGGVSGFVGRERSAEEERSVLGPGVMVGVELGSRVPGPSKAELPASDSSSESSAAVGRGLLSSS